MIIRALIGAIAVSLAACSQPAEAPPPAPPEVLSADAASAELVAAATPVVSQAIGQPITLSPTSVNIEGDWGWLIAQPQSQSGAPIDWSTTPFAVQAAEGVLDGGGTTYVLLKRENGVWRVLDHIIGPTDVAWMDWPRRHGVPPEVLGIPAN